MVPTAFTYGISAVLVESRVTTVPEALRLVSSFGGCGHPYD